MISSRASHIRRTPQPIPSHLQPCTPIVDVPATPPIVLLLHLLLLLTTPTIVQANIEKVIFPGPPANTPLTDANLDSLTPQRSVLRTNLSRVFPAAEGLAFRGQSSWLLLHDLVEGQRYELRVCWATVEPTSFALDLYHLHHVWRTPELNQSLNDYASSRRGVIDTIVPSHQQLPERKTSALLLHVRAAANYFTDDHQLMKLPPPVLVDLILDPYLYNVVPRSLVPIAGYLVLVGVVTWFLAQGIASSLESVAASSQRHANKCD
ncbi:hypothetical protein GQ602_006574 [Ophiocordyceps camponoti-floridani]|uniref:Uncharacterized protein n=1 Tax=Ophiocordyceps camponoti-floridani TaxID=2030778 RepID=A0A8H4Q1F8_9HYPO|nr:hypothetical protein GQ602_006574 [Ophiocordyceps camponoti-floridani]